MCYLDIIAYTGFVVSSIAHQGLQLSLLTDAEFTRLGSTKTAVERLLGDNLPTSLNDLNSQDGVSAGEKRAKRKKSKQGRSPKEFMEAQRIKEQQAWVQKSASRDARDRALSSASEPLNHL